MSIWRDRRDAAIEEYSQLANGDVTVAMQLLDAAIRDLPLSSNGEDLLMLLEAQERLQRQE